MSAYSQNAAIQLTNLAEGSPYLGETQEPPIPSPKETTNPTVLPHSDDPLPLHGETGIIPIIKLEAEARDNADTQDASRPKDETQTAPASNHQTDTPQKPPPVLIVEDTVELAEVIQATLENMGLEAVYATHGKTGLEKLRELNPELVMLDIGLPDITGWKMLDGIKEHYTERNLKMPVIIVITAYGDPANRLIGKLQNIYSYLVKPFTPDQVEKLVKLALHGARLPMPPDDDAPDNLVSN